MCEDLQTAAEYLPSIWFNKATDYGRITKGAALALMGKIRLWYASPLFNRGDEKERWQTAYEATKAAYDELFASSQIDNPGINASEWAKTFAVISPNPEAVFFTYTTTWRSTIIR